MDGKENPKGRHSRTMGERALTSLHVLWALGLWSPRKTGLFKGRSFAQCLMAELGKAPKRDKALWGRTAFLRVPWGSDMDTPPRGPLPPSHRSQRVAHEEAEAKVTWGTDAELGGLREPGTRSSPCGQQTQPEISGVYPAPQLSSMGLQSCPEDLRALAWLSTSLWATFLVCRNRNSEDSGQ